MTTCAGLERMNGMVKAMAGFPGAGDVWSVGGWLFYMVPALLGLVAAQSAELVL